ncbi:MAG: site-2 protease family protein [Candidatus Micrarchaeota archaeon]|nr:site-2 protease family protein [Candidatus Micrarchaeota archaeon]
MAKKPAKTTGKKRTWRPRAIGWGERGKALAVGLVAAAAFFATAFSDLGVYLKVVLALAVLCVSGILIERITGWQGWNGLLLIRGKKGFGLMTWVGESFPGACRAVTDYGLALCFGIPYSWWVFRSPRKVAAHAVVQVAVAWLITEGTRYSLPPWLASLVVLPLPAWLLGAAFFLFGFLGYGYLLIALNAFKIATVPDTPPGLMLVIPGVTLPLVEGVIAIAVVAAVHEVAHGIMCVVEKLDLKNSGVVLLGFLPVGAFVEPDEEKFKKIALLKKRRILVAGSTSNFIFFIVFLILFQGALAGLAFSTGGVQVAGVLENSSAYGVLETGESIIAVNGAQVKGITDLSAALAPLSQNQSIALQTDRGVKELVLGEGGRIGIMIQVVPAAGLGWLFDLSGFLSYLFLLTSIINLGLAVFNILPVFITDGHQIVREEVAAVLGRRRAALAGKISKAVGFATLALVAVNIILPWILQNI